MIVGKPISILHYTLLIIVGCNILAFPCASMTVSGLGCFMSVTWAVLDWSQTCVVLSQKKTVIDCQAMVHHAMFGLVTERVCFKWVRATAFKLRSPMHLKSL